MSEQENNNEPMSNVRKVISLYEVSRHMRIPFKWVRNAVLKSNEVAVYQVEGLPGQGLVVAWDDLLRVRDIVLVRVNDPDNPKPSVDPSVIQGALGKKKRK